MTLLTLLPTIVMLLVFGWALAILAGCINVLFQDTQHLVEVALQVLFYLTLDHLLSRHAARSAPGLGHPDQSRGRVPRIDPPTDPFWSNCAAERVCRGWRRHTTGRHCGHHDALAPRTPHDLLPLNQAKEDGEKEKAGRRTRRAPLTGGSPIIPPPSTRSSEETAAVTLISLENVGLVFHVRRHGRISLKEYLLRGLFRDAKKNSFEVRALEGINLQIGEGERVGIIGHNGAGKSTLLKLLAGIYPPDAGHCEIHGQISSLFELSLGFEPDASGWDNIMYRGFLQGETPRSIRAKMTAIAEFSELGEFLDMPIRYYSAGMLVRLAFSIATSIEPEILLLDEVLSAGDAAFQAKARQRMKSLISTARTVIVVSHELASLRAALRPHSLAGSWTDSPGRPDR